MQAGGKIILLHGASSSGKSTLARALQEAIEEPFWHISIDHLRDSGVLPAARIARGDFAWRSLRASFFSGFHRSLAAYASAGNNLIVEHILDTPGWRDELALLLEPYDVFCVGLHCPVEVLAQREADRGDRPVGSAAKDFATVHVGLRYDTELQSLNGVERNVVRLLEAWRGRRPPSAFAERALHIRGEPAHCRSPSSEVHEVVAYATNSGNTAA